MNRNNGRFRFIIGSDMLGLEVEEDHPDIPGRKRRARYSVTRGSKTGTEVDEPAPNTPVMRADWTPGETRTRWVQRRHLLKGVYWTNGRDVVWVRYNALSGAYKYVDAETGETYEELTKALLTAEED